MTRTGSSMYPVVTAKHAAALSAVGSCTRTARRRLCSSSRLYCLSSSEGFSTSPTKTRYPGSSSAAGTSFQTDIGRGKEAGGEWAYFEGTGRVFRWRRTGIEVGERGRGGFLVVPMATPSRRG